MDLFNAKTATEAIVKSKPPRSFVKRDELIEELEGNFESAVEYAEALNDAVQEVKDFLEELKETEERLDLKDFHANLVEKAQELLALFA